MTEQKRDWKPGDVGFVKGGGRVFFTGNGWVYADSGDRSILNLGQPCWNTRPLVVIDPKDPEQRERLIDLIARQAREQNGVHYHRETLANAVQAALEEFANPTPPKPDEPQGLGAVVEDAEGRVYTRYETSQEPQPWWQSAYGPEHDVVRRFHWADITAVRVLSEGVVQS